MASRLGPIRDVEEITYTTPKGPFAIHFTGEVAIWKCLTASIIFRALYGFGLRVWMDDVE